MIEYEKIIDFLTGFITHYRELLEFETKKLSMILADNVGELEKSLSKEQALVMKTNSLENKRISMMPGDSKSKTFKEIIADAPSELKPQLTSQYDELSRIVNQIKQINDKVSEILNHRITAMNEASGGGASIYNKFGTKGSGNAFVQGRNVTPTLNKETIVGGASIYNKSGTKGSENLLAQSRNVTPILNKDI